MRIAQDLMTKNVIAVRPETPLVEAANILLKNRFNGLPVVDNQNKVLGIITEYDLILKGTAIHLPTFLKIFQEMELYKKGSEPIREDLKKIFNIKVGEVMNSEPFVITSDTSIFKVVEVFSQHHRINPIIVVDSANILAGVISRHDLLKFLGDPSLQTVPNTDVDKQVDSFLNNYENKFELVSKFRTRFWLISSILFALVGFMIAFALIVRLH
jgi:CBS domain-containing protein